jgi:TPR repeat protein
VLATNDLGKVAEIRAKAEKGNSAAQNKLGVCYYEGKCE